MCHHHALPFSLCIRRFDLADVHTREQRHRNMAAIRYRDTKPEMYLRKLLWSAGYRYRIAPAYVCGRPDIFLRKYNAAIFVHGCFWHRHVGCRFSTIPKTNTEFWNGKFARNVERDRNVYEQLQCEGIRYAIIWECTLKRMRKDAQLESCIVSKLIRFIESSDAMLEL